MKGYVPSIRQAVLRHASAKVGLARAVARQQRRCRHLELIECDYMKLYSGALPPTRLCCACGMSEDGWGSGYFALKGRAVLVDRETIYALRLGLAIGDEHKGPLLRNEVTVAALIDKALAKELAGMEGKANGN